MTTATTEFAVFVQGLGLSRPFLTQGDLYALIAREGRGRGRPKAIFHMVTADRLQPATFAVWLPRLDQWLELLEEVWPSDPDDLGNPVRPQILKRLALWVFDNPEDSYEGAAARLYQAVVAMQAVHA